MENVDILYDLCETISGEIEDANMKIRQAGGKLSAGDVEYIDKLTHTLKSLKTTIAMMEADEGDYSGAGGYGGYAPMTGGSNISYAQGGSRGGNRGGGTSYARNGRGRGSNAKRDSMGRYSSRGGYSRDGGGVKEMLEDAMEEASNEREREAIRRALGEISR